MKLRKIATNIPDALLKQATMLTGLNQTQALIAGLNELIAREKRRELLALGGKIRFSPISFPTKTRKRAKT